MNLIDDGIMRKKWNTMENVTSNTTASTNTTISHKGLAAESAEIQKMLNELNDLISYDEWSAQEYGNTEVDTYVTAINLHRAGYRKTGFSKWVQVDDTKCRCTNCDAITLITQYPNGSKNYCPNCGAIMDDGV